MNTSPSIGAVAAALAKAQGDFPPVVKGKTAKAGAYSYDYADLADIIAALQPALAANELSVMQDASVEMVNDQAVAVVSTTVLHSSGEWITSGAVRLAAADHSAQKIGAVLTYARRYSYGAMLCVSPEADTDGQTENPVDRKQHAPPQQVRAPQASAARTVEAPKSTDRALGLWDRLVRVCEGDKIKARKKLDGAIAEHFGVDAPPAAQWHPDDYKKIEAALFDARP